MKVALTLCAAVVASLAVAGCNCPQKKKSPPAPGETSSSTTGAAAAAPAATCATCAKGAKGEAVWCDACGHGFVAGQKVTCKGCYAAKTGGPACATCATKKT